MKFDVLLFTKIMTSLLKSGLVFQDALYVASDIMEGKRNRDFIQKLYEEIEKGSRLSDELCKHEKLFGLLYVSLVKIGEESGKLIEVFERLEEYISSKKDRKEKLLQSLMYPVIVLLTAVLVIIVSVIFVFPKLESIFEAFGENAGLLNEKILSMKESFSILSSVFIVIISLVILLFVLCRNSRTIKCKTDEVLLKIPFLRKEIIFNSTYDFSFSMKLLSSAYYPFDKSIKLSADVVGNLYYRKAVLNVYEKVANGADVCSSFKEEKIFPAYFTSWIKLAEKNGNLNSAFNEIYEYFKQENRTSAERLGTAAEPFFILITGIIVIIMIAQFVVPVFRMMGTL